MARSSLKRILARKNGVGAAFAALLQALDTPIGVEDVDGNLLIGAHPGDPLLRTPIVLNGETIGWVIGNGEAGWLVDLLTHLGAAEDEKKALADEVLERYRELNLYYNLSEKMSAFSGLKAAAQTALDEAGRLIRNTGGGVMLLTEDRQELQTIVVIGTGFFLDASINLRDGIVGSVADKGKAEIVDDIRRDGRSIDSDAVARSMACVPLIARNQVIGVIVMVSAEPNTYTAGDLKLLNTLASQAAPAIENALIYEKTLQEAQEREARLKNQIRELRIELDEARQAKQVEEITETDYFKRLHQQALQLRGIMEGEKR